MISEHYLEQNRQLHESHQHYGESGYKFAGIVRDLCQQYKTLEILDYGCGKATLEKVLGPTYVVRNYDPCIPIYAEKPIKSDFVTCTDVMEHIEPKFINAVLDDIASLTGLVCLMTIANRPARKSLPDGRNAHLTQKSYRWWLPKLWDRMNIMHMDNLKDKEYLLVLEPK